LTNELAELEIGICKAMIVETSDDKDNKLKDRQLLLQTSAEARTNLTSAADAINGELREHLLKNNTSSAGIITWIKPGVSTDLRPEPIHFKEVMSFLLDNEDYESNGYDLFDFCNEEVDVQYNNIMALLQDKHIAAPSQSKKLSFPPYERMKHLYFSEGINQRVDYSKLVESMSPILKTSMHMLDNVKLGSIKVSLSGGTFKQHV
jgi:hypothetical protein